MSQRHSPHGSWVRPPQYLEVAWRGQRGAVRSRNLRGTKGDRAEIGQGKGGVEVMLDAVGDTKGEGRVYHSKWL